MPLYIMVIIIAILETTTNIMVMVMQDIKATDYGNMDIMVIDSDTMTLNITDNIKGSNTTELLDITDITIIPVFRAQLTIDNYDTGYK
ncbi:MAG: hypothetical protein ACE5KZ_00490 [Candidatus Scalinduaceae bacterium]